MPHWRPQFFPELSFPVANVGTDTSVLKKVTLRILGMSPLAPQQLEIPESLNSGLDTGLAIIIDTKNPSKAYVTNLLRRFPKERH